MSVNKNPITGRFVKGNKAAYKGKRRCASHPYCKVRIDDEKYPNKLFCSDKCRKWFHKALKRYSTLKLKSSN